jgi:tetratricopeptide (TPR) repeat protein
LQLETLDSGDGPTNRKKIDALIETGNEEPLKTFLLLKRKAKRQMTWAYFQRLEERDDKTRLDLAFKEYMKALDIATDLFEEGDFEIFNLYNKIGSCRLQQDDLPEAERYYQKGLDIIVRKADAQQRPYAGIGYNNLGNLEEMKGNAVKSLEYYQKALTAAKDSAEIPVQMRSVATQLLKLGRYAESIAMFEQIIRDVKAPGLIRAYDYQALGLAYVRINKNREAIPCYQQAIALFFEYYGEENEKFLKFYNDIGWCYGLCQEYEKAIPYYEKVIALETNDEHIFIAMNNIGEAHYNSGNFKMAKETFDESLAFLRSKISEREHPDGYAYCYQKIKQATDHLQKG